MSDLTRSESEPQISASGGTLVVDGKTLDLVKNPADSQRSIEAEELKRILQADIARRAILSGLAASYRVLEQKRLSDPDLTISAPPLFVVRLGLQKQLTSIITPAALGGFKQTGNKSIYTDINEIEPPYQAYWRAISENGFLPDVLTNYGSGHITGSIYLRLHAPHAEMEEELGYEFPEKLRPKDSH